MKRKKYQYISNIRMHQKEETRSNILESAKTLFEKLGFGNTTLRKIAADADVGVGTIFNYFPNKPSLLIAALLDDLDKVEVIAFGELPDHSTIVEKCVHITKTYYAYYANRPALSRTLLKEANFIQGEFADLLDARTNRFIRWVQELMVKAQENGELHEGTNCKLAALAFFSFFLRCLFKGISEPKFEIDHSIDMLRSLLEQHMDGIACKGKEQHVENRI